METIAFTKVKLPHGWLGNMSPYPVEYEGTRYRTTEALFQCLRFPDHPEVQAEIRAQKSPMAAKMIAKKHRHHLQRGREWDSAESDIDLMRICLELKLLQHPDLRRRLRATGDSLIVEDCTARPRGSARFWGMVLDEGRWVGQNVLGKLWMELREQLADCPSPLESST